MSRLAKLSLFPSADIMERTCETRIASGPIAKANSKKQAECTYLRALIGESREITVSIPNGWANALSAVVQCTIMRYETFLFFNAAPEQILQ